MNVLLLAYDHVAAAQNGSEPNIVALMQAQPSWARILPNLYVVTTTVDAPQLRDQFLNTSGVRVAVFNITNSLWATNAVPLDVSQWLQTNWKQP
ncbi:MAG: hypothetical protein ACHQT9_03570 [Candidatus Saccharimonadales bacterium]